jgi:hypothetical protein
MGEPISDKRTLEILQSLSPVTENGTDVVTKASRDMLITCVQTDVRVHGVFFPLVEPHPLQKTLDLR